MQSIINQPTPAHLSDHLQVDEVVMRVDANLRRRSPAADSLRQKKTQKTQRAFINNSRGKVLRGGSISGTRNLVHPNYHRQPETINRSKKKRKGKSVTYRGKHCFAAATSQVPGIYQVYPTTITGSLTQKIPQKKGKVISFSGRSASWRRCSRYQVYPKTIADSPKDRKQKHIKKKGHEVLEAQQSSWQQSLRYQV